MILRIFSKQKQINLCLDKKKRIQIQTKFANLTMFHVCFFLAEGYIIKRLTKNQKKGKKMRKTLLCLATVLAAILCGCTTYYRDSGADYLIRPQTTAGAPYYTEFEINNKQITSGGNAAVLLGFIQIAENKRCLSVINPQLSIFSIIDDILSPTYKAISNAKNIALYNACTENNADQLLGVTFDYTVKDYLFYAKVNCTVKGFPAKVKGVKMIDKKPIILNKWQKIEYVKPHENPFINAPQEKQTFSLDVFK